MRPYLASSAPVIASRNDLEFHDTKPTGIFAPVTALSKETIAMVASKAAAPSAIAVNPRAHWPLELQRELEDNRFNPIVGSVLVSETDKVRVWHLHVPAGKRCTFHRHVLDYFWTCHSHGRARGYFEDGSITETVHFPGDTRHLHYGPGEYLLHSVENIGDTDLLFTTVEFLQSANTPLPVPDGVRLQQPG
jgi:hypothetical protein